MRPHVLNGEELLQEIATALLGRRWVSPDVIVSDIRMAGRTGMDILAGLRNRDWRLDWAHRVILITAFGDEETHVPAPLEREHLDRSNVNTGIGPS